MKLKCVTNDHGYEHKLVEGKEYEVLDIREGTFPGDHYIVVDIGGGKKATTLRYRFDITKEEADAYMRERG